MPFFLTNFISALFFAQTALFFAQIFLQFGIIQYNFAASITNLNIGMTKFIIYEEYDCNCDK